MEDQHQVPPVSCPEEGKAGGAPPRVGRTLGSAEPRWVPGQMHFNVEYPLRFLKAMAKVSLQRDGRNWPLAIKGSSTHSFHTHHNLEPLLLSHYCDLYSLG
jgi:hypothetical protein